MARQAFTELEAYGVRSPLAFTEVRQGPFFLDVSFPDNATTAVDLTAAAAISQDPQLSAMGAASSQPAIFLVITAVQWSLAFSTESQTLITDSIRSAYIKHQPAGAMERRVPLGDAMTTIQTSQSSGTDAQYQAIMRRPYRLQNPMAISLRRDPTVEVAFTTAVNWATGAINGTLKLYGYAMPDSDNYAALPCTSGAQAASFAGGRLKAFKTLT